MTTLAIAPFSSPVNKYPIGYATASNNSPNEVWRFFSEGSPNVKQLGEERFLEIISLNSSCSEDVEEGCKGAALSEGSLREDRIEPGKYCLVREITKSSSEKEVRVLKKVLKAWKDIADDRLAPLRCYYNDDSLPEVVRMKAREDFDKDRAIVNSYKDLINGIDVNITTVFRPAPTAYQVRYILDLTNSFWSVCSYMVCLAEDEVPSHLYLDKLVTSPLTCPAYFDETKSSRVPVIKGAGVLMMHSLYSTAQKLGLSELRLKALDGSVSFYERIGMTRHNPYKSNEYFSYHVAENYFPPFLMEYMASKNLTPVDVSSLDI